MGDDNRSGDRSAHSWIINSWRAKAQPASPRGRPRGAERGRKRRPHPSTTRRLPPSSKRGTLDLGGSDPPDHRVWSRIERWMDSHAPEALDVLRPGVDDESMDRAEEILELELPESFRRSLARHDGQEVRWPSLVEFGFLMPLQQIIDDSRALAELYDERSGATAADEWWRPGLMPFVSRDGDYLCLDLKPPKGRPHGEVWALLHDDEPVRSRIAADFDAWLERWAHELDAGVFYLDRAAGAGLLPRRRKAISSLARVTSTGREAGLNVWGRARPAALPAPSRSSSDTDECTGS